MNWSGWKAVVIVINISILVTTRIYRYMLCFSLFTFYFSISLFVLHAKLVDQSVFLCFLTPAIKESTRKTNLDFEAPKDRPPHIGSLKRGVITGVGKRPHLTKTMMSPWQKLQRF